MGHIKTHMGHIKSHMGHIKTLVGHIKTLVGQIRTQMTSFGQGPCTRRLFPREGGRQTVRARVERERERERSLRTYDLMCVRI